MHERVKNMLSRQGRCRVVKNELGNFLTGLSPGYSHGIEEKTQNIAIFRCVRPGESGSSGQKQIGRHAKVPRQSPHMLERELAFTVTMQLEKGVLTG